MFGVFIMFESSSMSLLDEYYENRAGWQVFDEKYSGQTVLEYFSRIYAMERENTRDLKVAASKGNEIRIMSLRSVSHITSRKRQLTIHGDEGEFEFYAGFGKTARKLEKFGFVQISNYCLIALEHIKTAGYREVELTCGKSFNVGRKFINEYRKKVDEICDLKLN